MQSVDNREKITILILLAASTILAVLGHDLGARPEAAESGADPARLLLAAALAGSVIAILMLLSPGKTHRSLRATLRDAWPTLAGLTVLVAGYALALQSLGFFIATTLFLAMGSILLGERRLWSLLLAIPVAAALAFALHGVFGLSLDDPLMHALGLIA